MLLGGLIFTSDHIGEYSEAEMDLYLDSLKYKDAQVINVFEAENIYIEVKLGNKRELFIFNLRNKSNIIDFPSNLNGKYKTSEEKISPRSMMKI